MPSRKNKSLCLVCSSGGHLFELYSLKSFWSNYDRFWITFPKVDAEHILSGERVYYAYYPTQRNMRNFLRNLTLAWRVLRTEKPTVIVSTGAGVGVPFLFLGKVLKITTIWIESLTRINGLSLSGKLVYPIADEFLVQWPELANKYKKAKYEGQVI